MPANVPVTKASSQSLISSKVKFVSLQGISFILHTLIALLLVIPLRQNSPVEVNTLLFLIKKDLWNYKC